MIVASSNSIVPPNAPGGSSDDFAAAVARRLGAALPNRGAWGLLGTVILGIVSFGILPLLVWPLRFNEFANEEARAIGELSQWARVRGKRPAAIGPVMAAAADVGPWPMALLACLMVVLFVIAVFAMFFANESLTWDGLMAVTYYHRLGKAHPGSDHAEHLYRIWIAVLSVGYLLHWVHVRAHIADVRQFAARLNPLIESEFLPPLALPSRCVGMKFLWIVAAVLMGLYGIWWGIPMLMAGAAQRRYMRYGGPLLRRELAVRMSDIAAQRRMPTAPAAAQRCANVRCMAQLRGGARFCSRCGSAIAAGR